MSVILDEREEWRNSIYLKKQEYGDFTPFYIAITICSVIGLSIFIVNIVLGCCSRYSTYWNDRHTGNRWIVSLWSATPHNQPSLDHTELADVYVPPQQQVIYHHPPAPQLQQHPEKVEYSELQKRESDI